MRRFTAFPIAFAAALAVSFAATPSQAFCWASTCQPNGVICEVASQLDCGMPLYWPRACVGYSIQQSGTNQLSDQQVSAAVAAGFGVWMQPFCNGELPGIGLVELQPVACNRVEYNSAAGNANIVVFRDEEWTHPDSPDKIALTTVTYSPDTGHIYNVDIEVNTALFQFTVGDDNVLYDLSSIMAHEAGHFYGLGHSLDWDATMFEIYEPGSVEERSLTEDDQRGICAMYPPWPIDRESCNPIPRHGFASECKSDQPEHGCNVSGQRTHPLPWLAIGLVCAWVARSRRNPRS